MAPVTTFGFLTRESLRDRATGAWLLEHLCRMVPAATPTRFSDFEPIQQPFVLPVPDRALETWERGPSFLWRMGRGPSLGQYWPASPGHPADLFTFTLRGATVDTPALEAYLAMISSRSAPVFGYVNTVFPEELSDLEDYRVRLQPLAEGLTLHGLNEGAFAIPGAMVIGRALVDDDAVATLEGLPVAEVRALPSSVFVRLFTAPRALRSASGIRDARARIAEHFGLDRVSAGHLWRGRSAAPRAP